jgi:regulator of sirC expression with transglutaminase-like and TPR domain
MDLKSGKYFQLIRADEADWDLYRLTLEICRIFESEIDFNPYQEFVNQLAAESRAELGSEKDLYSQIEAMNSIIYGRYGFRANREDYQNPLNSYMTAVIDRRLGIPITLSILYREIASRIGLSLNCVGLPGHFLLKFRHSNQEIFIDAFAEGKMILADECRQMVQTIYAGRIDFKPAFLQRVGIRATLLRLLVNLKQIYRNLGLQRELLRVIEHRIPLLNDPHREILERGLTRLGLKDYQGAIDDIDFFLDHTSDERIRKILTARLEKIRRLSQEP